MDRRFRLHPFAVVFVTLVALSSEQGALSEPLNRPTLAMSFETTGRLAIVPVSVNGSRPFRCILDTGMPEGLFLMDPAHGARLGLEYSSTAALQGTGKGTQTGRIATGATLQLGDLSFDGQHVVVLGEANELSSMGIDGVIGATVFKRYVVELNFERSTLHLFDPATFDSREAGDSIPMTIVATKPYVAASVSLIPGRPTPVTLLVDSGANLGLMLDPNVNEAIDPPVRSLAAVVASGVGGDVTGVLGRVAGLQLGTHALEQLVTEFPDSPQGRRDGTIGMGVLRRFVTTIDYPNGRLMLRPGISFGEPFEYNMAGLVLRPRAGDRLSVHSVIDRSPAARAGIRPGDLILAINGRPLAEIGYVVMLRLFEEPGATLELIIERGGQRVGLAVTLERLI